MVAPRDLLWVKPYKLDQMETDKKITSSAVLAVKIIIYKLP